MTLDEDLVELIPAEAEGALGEFLTVDGQTVFDAPAVIVTAQA